MSHRPALLLCLCLMSYGIQAAAEPPAATTSAATAIDHGNRRLEQGDAQGALALFDQAARQAPRDPRPRYLRGAALAKLGQHEAAVSAYRLALSLDDSIAEVHNELGVSLVKLGQLAEATRVFAQAVRLRPAYSEAWTNYGRVLIQRRELEEAVRVLRQAQAALPTDADLRIDLSAALRQLKQIDQALLVAREAVKLAPRSADAHLNLGFTLQARHELDEAAAAAAVATDLDPTSALAWRTLGSIERERSHPDLAVAAFERALRLRPSIQATVELSLALLTRRDYRSAERLLRAALEKNRRSMALRTTLARALAASNKCKEASELLAPLPTNNEDIEAVRKDVAELCRPRYSPRPAR